MSFKPAHKPNPHGIGNCKKRSKEHYQKMAKIAHEKHIPPILERFYSKVLKGADDECWEWTAYKTRQGSARFGMGKRAKVASRVAWELQYGPIPNGLNVLHHCDNMGCVNHHHLFLGTQKDNVQDMLQKGRTNNPYGENHRDCKLTVSQVKEIRSSPLSWSCLAKQFKVSKGAIQKIKNRTSWRHVE